MEKIIGADVSSVVDVPIADGIEFRLETLVDYLETQGFDFPFDVVTNGIINWPSLSVGGHSQGATHALYLSKYFFARHACLLAGGYDISDTTPNIPAEGVADWLLDNSVAIDTANIRAFVSVDDNSYNAFVAAYGVLGMVPDVHYREISGAAARSLLPRLTRFARQETHFENIRLGHIRIATPIQKRRKTHCGE